MKEKTSDTLSKNSLYLIIGVLVITSIAFRLIGNRGLEQTSVLFVGLPALITLLMVKYSNTPKTAYGLVFKVITIFLLMSSILLGEGIVCILMAAPIFYGLAAIIVFLSEYSKKKNKEKLFSLLIIPLIVVIAQPFDINVEPEIQTVETYVAVPDGVAFDAFNTNPDFLQDYPDFFKVGFPKPIKIAGNGTNIGDKRNIQFESKTKGIGTLSLEIIHRSDSKIVFNPIHDNTHINHWLTWNKITVEIIKGETNGTKIKWTSQYQCDLGPSWYFEPLEATAIEIMNKHLINAYFN